VKGYSLNEANGFQLFSIEAEQALIGAVLINNDAFRAVDGIVKADDFGELIHVDLWRV